MIDPKLRSSMTDILIDKNFLGSLDLFKNVLNSIFSLTLILNNKRQIVYASNDFFETFKIPDIGQILGFRPGEIMSCIHSSGGPDGCGSNTSCSVCGAVNAVRESQQTKTKVSKEAYITSLINGNRVSWEFLVVVNPLLIDKHEFYVVTLKDISVEKRKEKLEKLFLHDVVNTVGSLNGLAKQFECNASNQDDNHNYRLISMISETIYEQIISFKEMLLAEKGELIVKKTTFTSRQFLKDLLSHYSETYFRKIVKLSPDAEDLSLFTDKTLLTRIMINMLKNAVETPLSGKDQNIIFGCKQTDTSIRFWVKNNYYIPVEIQMQIFQRSFTSKGEGRGLGTYSMKLLGEKYLNGKVNFTSTELDGTIFYIDLPKNI